MKKSFAFNLFLVISLNALVKPFYIFAIDREVQNQVGATEYGLYFALFNFVYLFQIFNDFGIQNFNHSVFSKYDFLIPKYLPKILGAKILLAVAFSLSTSLFALIIGFEEFFWPLLTLILINQILASLLMYLRTTSSALGQYRLDSILSVTDKVIMIFTVGYILVFTPWGSINILQFILCQSFSLLVSILAAAALLYRINPMLTFRPQVDWSFTRSLLKKSFPYAMVLFLMTIYTRIDGVMIERLLPDGKEQAGIYAASYRILDAFAMVGLLFAGLLLPIYAKIISRGDSVSALTSLARNLLSVFALTVVAISLIYHQEIVQVLYDQATPYWGSVYQILFLSYLGVSLSYIYGTLLTAHESIDQMNRIFVVGVISNLVLNIYFIEAWQAWGAALATVITQTLTAIALTVLAHQRLSLKFSLRHWFAIALNAGVIYLMTWWSASWQLPLLVSWALIGITAVTTGIALGLLRFADWQGLQISD